MTRLMLAALGVLIAGSPAISADLPVKAPIIPVAVTNWTGFYLGVNAGYGWSRSEIDPRGTNNFCNPLLGGCPPTNVSPGGIAADVASAAIIPPALNPNGRGGLVGGTIGYNKQIGFWVIGIEADMAWANIVGSDNRVGGPITITGPTPPAAGFSSAHRPRRKSGISARCEAASDTRRSRRCCSMERAALLMAASIRT